MQSKESGSRIFLEAPKLWLALSLPNVVSACTMSPRTVLSFTDCSAPFLGRCWQPTAIFLPVDTHPSCRMAASIAIALPSYTLVPPPLLIRILSILHVQLS